MGGWFIHNQQTRGGALRAILRCLVLGTLFFGSTAVAQEPSAKHREQARGLMDLGDQEMATGDYEAALKAYQAADEIMAVPTTGIEVGRAQEKLGYLLEARDSWVQVTRYPKKENEPAPFTRARREAARLAVAIEEVIPTVSVSIEGPPPGETTLFLDGERLPKASLGVPLRVNPGEHTFRAEASGYVAASSKLVIAKGESPSIVLHLTPSSIQASPKPTENERERDRDEGASSPHPLVWVGFGVGGAGVAAGSVFGVLSMNRIASVKDRCDETVCPRSTEDDLRAGKRSGTISTVAFTVGAVGLASGLYFLIRPPQSRTSNNDEHALSWRLVSIPGGASMGVRGSFR